MANRAIQNGLRILPRIVPFFVSAGLYLSGIFALFSPLPLLLVGFTYGFRWLVLAGVTNALIVYFTSGPELFQFYCVGVFSAAFFVQIFLLQKRFTLEKTLAVSWVGSLTILCLLILAYAKLHGLPFLQEFRQLKNAFLDLVIQSLSPESKTQLLGDMTPLEWKQKSDLEVAFGVSAMLMIYLNMNLLMTFNPGNFIQKLGIDRKAIFSWKNSELLVWPMIGTWGLAILTKGRVSDVAMSILKLFLAAYGLQGLAILGSVLNSWKIRGFFRMFIYGMAVFFMMPLVLGVGFFDQWFDFRAKLRQS